MKLWKFQFSIHFFNGGKRLFFTENALKFSLECGMIAIVSKVGKIKDPILNN